MSTDWYTRAYKGSSPPVDVPFPRPLYPPDAAPAKRPSVDGPDCVALKRALCRGGRWGIWDPASWDDSFSNAFSHGKPGTDKPKGYGGIASFQRAQKIDDTGWVGQKTFDNLRYALISDPAAPHYGEPLFDSVCVSLLNEAFELFEGAEPEGSHPRELAMQHMDKRVGYTEQPANSNCDNRSDGIRTSQDHCAGGGTWLRNQPWCGCWVFYALETAGVKPLDSSLASVAAIEDQARAKSLCFRGWTTDRSQIDDGDLIIIGGYGQHVEMVRGPANPDGSVPSWGGNTSPQGGSGSQSDGGGAYARTRYPSEIRGFALVRFPGE